MPVSIEPSLRDQGGQPLISVTLVCYNGAGDIRRCMEALRAQSWKNLEIVAIDNASSDDSLNVLAEFPEVRVIANTVNTGYPAAQNQAINATSGEWIVSLNLDTKATATFIEAMWAAAQIDSRIGGVCPKILRMEQDGSEMPKREIDATGIFPAPNMRHHNRGSGELDHGQYDVPDYVFGYTGAAALFRRAMLEDLAVDGEYLDEDFFAYREDADLSWRAQLAGWHFLYTPYSVIFHKRHVFEHNRDKVSPLINMHSTKNRFIMRINNITPRLYLSVFLPATIRDAGIILYVLCKERSSLPGLLYVWRERKRLFAKRRKIQSMRRVDEDYLREWFSSDPVSFPLDPERARRLQKI
jgi:GT2 family glycosyltransferase